MKTVVVNVRGNVRIYAGCDVYIGRPSIFGNPFHIGRDGTREEVIAKYRACAVERMATDPKFAAAVHGLRGKRLGCFCAPLPCHGDVLVELADAEEQVDIL